MKALFLDVNVVLDFLLKRTPFDVAALRLFQLAEQKQVRLYVSAVTFNNAYYIAGRLQSPAQALQLMIDSSGFVAITPVTEEVIQQALTSGFRDFEDAIQYFSALQQSAIEAILTRNQKDFVLSQLSVYTPEEFLRRL